MADEKPNEPRKQGIIAGLSKFNYAKLNEDGTWSPVEKPPPNVSNFTLFAPVVYPPFDFSTAELIDNLHVEYTAWFAANGGREQLQPKRIGAEDAAEIDGSE